MSEPGPVRGHNPTMAEIDVPSIRRYLLGQLDDSGCAALEDRLFAEPEFAEDVRCEEADLIDDYVRGRLAAVERAAFEGHYLRTPGHRERVALSRALLAAADRAAGAVSSRAPWAYWLAAVAATVLIASWLSGLRPSGHPSVARVEPTAGPSAPAPLPEPPSPSAGTSPTSAGPRSSVSILLVSGLSRGEEHATALVVPRGTDDVLLHLDADVATYADVRAAVSLVGGGTVWKGAAGRARTAGAHGATARVPASALPPQDYIVSLEGRSEGGSWEEIERYALRVAEQVGAQKR